MSPAIGCRLREARKAKRLTLRDVSALVGVSHVFVGEVERGQRPLPANRREKFSEVYGITVADLTEIDAPTVEVLAERLAAYGGCDRAVAYLREIANP